MLNQDEQHVHPLFWLMGFGMATGMAKMLHVEALAIVEGMKLTWRNGYKQFEVNYDNVLLIDTICNGFTPI